MIYLKQFDNETDYANFRTGDDYRLPSVALVGNGNIGFNNYEDTPLTFQIVGDSDYEEGDTYCIYLEFDGEDTSYERTISYRINGGEWKEATFGADTIDDLEPGDLVQFKSDDSFAYCGKGASSDLNINFFECSTKFNVFGNLNSLNNYEPYNVRQFAYLFANCGGLLSAEKLFIPDEMNESCYDYMFLGCANLVKPPVVLPATSLVESCYRYMFAGCSSLRTAPELPAIGLDTECYFGMFSGCTSLTDAPSLPAGDAEPACYGYMFQGCTSLTGAPVISLDDLSTDCCSNMFLGCTSLTVAPELQAHHLISRCYYGMFSGCTSLSYAKCLATRTFDSSATSYWLDGVSSSGTFVKDSSATFWSRDKHGIPANWTVLDE